MIEEVILNYLRENAFSCYMSMPEKPSGNFCILEKTGDSPDEGIYTATLAVQSYGSSRVVASSQRLCTPKAACTARVMSM